MKEKERFRKMAIIIMACVAGIVMLSGMAGAVGTKFINNNSTGGDCTLIGAWNSTTKTCTLMTDLFETVQIDSNGVTLDGNGHTITGTNEGAGVYVYLKDGITIKNINAVSFANGIFISYSDKNNLIDNVLESDGYGIHMEYSNDSFLANNSVHGTMNLGISLLGFRNTLNNNSLSQSSNGIAVGCCNNILNNNNVTNGYITVTGSYNILERNTVSNAPAGVGAINIINSDYNTLKRNKLSNNPNGIYIDSSDGNILEDNIISFGEHGIYLQSGWYNQFLGNFINQNVNDGFFIAYGYNNIIRENNISFSYYGIYTQGANNKIYHNNIVNFSRGAYDVHGMDEWDNGYPSGGNYWSNYLGIDSNSDGIGDIPYVIQCSDLFCQGGPAQDKYPLMFPYNGTTITLIPNQPTNLTQLKSDATTSIPIGTTNERIVVFKARVSDPDGHQVKLQVELRGLNENNGQFNESLGGLKESELVPNGSIATAMAVELINGDYHWRARTVDANGNKSAWVGFGENPTSEADFTVSQGFEIVVISDIHIGPDIEKCFGYVTPTQVWGKKCGDLWLDSLEKFIGVIEKVKADNPNFVIVTGDSVEWNNPSFYQGFSTQILKLNKDIYVVPGNHDRRGIQNPEDKVGAAWPCEDISCMDNYIVFVGGKGANGSHGDYTTGYNYYFDRFGYRFIGLDSGYDPLLDAFSDSKLRENPTGSGLSPEQVQFVRDNAVNGKTIVVMHHPTNDIDNKYNTISRNREQLINVEWEKNIKLTIGGHTHDFGYFYNPEFLTSNYLSPICGFCDEGLPRNLMVQTRSATKGNPSGYTIVDIGKNKDGEILVRDVKILGDKIEQGKTLSIYSPADLNLYDEYGRHTGPNASGGIDNQIPNSYYIQGAKIGNITLPESVILYNTTLTYRTEIVSNFSKENITTEQSHFNFTIEERTGGEIKTTEYNNVVIEANSRAYVENTSQSMQVDLNNDGTNETVKVPDSVVIDHAPIAAITSPANNSTWDQGQAITFSGAGTDLEDGTLNDLVWISDRDDVIGHGSFSTINLSAGTHYITLRVNDSIGQVNISGIVLNVRDTMPPSVIIDYPLQNKIFKNPNIIARGIAFDDSGIANVTVNGIQAGQDNWNANITLSEGENTIEVVATDNAGFTSSANRTVNYNSSLASDMTPPSAITNLAYTTGYDNATGVWINWTWTNPSDSDFSHAIVYLDNIPMGNISGTYRNFTGLSSNASYNISIKTADVVDNINHTEVNSTARTPPIVTHINGAVIDSITKAGITGVIVSINSTTSTVSNVFGFYSLAVSEGEYSLSARLDPAYYANNTIPVLIVGNAVVAQDIELVKKPTGNITGSVKK